MHKTPTRSGTIAPIAQLVQQPGVPVLGARDRRVAMQRDGNVHASRWCAAATTRCVFSPGLRERRFDDPNTTSARCPGRGWHHLHDLPCDHEYQFDRGNADFTIEEPLHYPFAFSDKPILKWVNRQLVKSKPAFHKKTFLKDLHRSPEFCSSCHKVHLPSS